MTDRVTRYLRDTGLDGHKDGLRPKGWDEPTHFPSLRRDLGLGYGRYDLDLDAEIRVGEPGAEDQCAHRQRVV